MEPNISVVLLCYRSGEQVRDFVERVKDSLESFDNNWEIILVGNYFPNTNDSTPDVVREIAAKHPQIQSVVREKEGMMGWDMRSGLYAAKGKYIAVIDGDGQMPLEDVVRVYKKMIEGNYDMVKTYRTKRDDGVYRKLLSYFYNVIFRVLFPGSNFRDVNAKPKIIKREYLNKMNLKSDGWFVDAEIMIIALRLKMKILELPTTFNEILTRPSFVKPWAVFEFLVNLISYRFQESFYKKSKNESE